MRVLRLAAPGAGNKLQTVLNKFGFNVLRAKT